MNLSSIEVAKSNQIRFICLTFRVCNFLDELSVFISLVWATSYCFLLALFELNVYKHIFPSNNWVVCLLYGLFRYFEK